MVCVLLLYFFRDRVFFNDYGVPVARDDVYGDAVEEVLSFYYCTTLPVASHRVKERLGLEN